MTQLNETEKDLLYNAVAELPPYPTIAIEFSELTEAIIEAIKSVIEGGWLMIYDTSAPKYIQIMYTFKPHCMIFKHAIPVPEGQVRFDIIPIHGEG